MTKYEILAQAFDPITGEPISNPRIEVINTSENTLFAKCESLTDIVEAYMAFWNRLPTYQKELVLVQSIQEIPNPEIDPDFLEIC
jgi:hypothetical protein